MTVYTGDVFALDHLRVFDATVEMALATLKHLAGRYASADEANLTAVTEAAENPVALEQWTRASRR